MEYQLLTGQAFERPSGSFEKNYSIVLLISCWFNDKLMQVAHPGVSVTSRLISMVVQRLILLFKVQNNSFNSTTNNMESKKHKTLSMPLSTVLSGHLKLYNTCHFSYLPVRPETNFTRYKIKK